MLVTKFNFSSCFLTNRGTCSQQLSIAFSIPSIIASSCFLLYSLIIVIALFSSSLSLVSSTFPSALILLRFSFFLIENFKPASFCL
ncbi:hypothetical protein FGO68_gene5620 [Halteria grandinella]|uniref:Uncharacterized protein n=1 Tax=Halteria grandinella TaxID=5974 RepID=A0A8J8NNN5_HALGN|nr:hypothetical protein FGO68_gene5620 [Halteria grandinella]